ncbi:MAG: histone deacetylase [Acidobacteriota bacterium]|nr:histone deacetylase [Acidobacteriota bacterium]
MTDLVDSVFSLFGLKLPLKFIYANEYWMVDLGPHIFPIKKYRMLYEKVIALGARAEDFIKPEPASNDDLLLVHTPGYVNKVRSGTLSSLETQALEMPYSPKVVRFFLLMTGGTIKAAEEALRSGLAVHLGGGFHHAFPDHGEGFCLFNDVAIALEKMKREGRIKRALIIDGDLHQGNGTAYIFSKKDYVFTFSIHQKDIYPSCKPASNLDVDLWSGDNDEAYLKALEPHIPRLYEECKPDLVIYIAGADPYQKDMLSGLDLSASGLRKRDRLVIEQARRLKIPLAIVLGGGYADEIEETVDIHLNTIKEAIRASRRGAQQLVASLISSK